MTEEEVRKRLENNLDYIYAVLEDFKKQCHRADNLSMSLNISGEVFEDLCKKFDIIMTDYFDLKRGIKQYVKWMRKESYWLFKNCCWWY